MRTQPRTRTASLSPGLRKALVGAACATVAALTLWAAALGAMALTPVPGGAAMGQAAETVYQPTGLISAQPDADGKPQPALKPAVKPGAAR